MSYIVQCTKRPDHYELVIEGKWVTHSKTHAEVFAEVRRFLRENELPYGSVVVVPQNYH